MSSEEPKMSGNRWLLILLIAVGVGITSFLFIDSYQPHMGVLWNVINARITIIDTKPNPPPNKLCWGKPDDDPGCKTTTLVVEYKWIAGFCIALIVYAVFLR